MEWKIRNVPLYLTDEEVGVLRRFSLRVLKRAGAGSSNRRTIVKRKGTVKHAVEQATRLCIEMQREYEENQDV